MARISFEDYQKVQENKESTKGDGVGFLALKNDGDEALVRIIHDSTDSFDTVGVHNVKVGDYYKNVSCLRRPGESSDKCPLCASGMQVKYRCFVHMVQYTKDEQGNITARPVVWERAAKEMTQKLTTMLQEYGPLSDCLFKIRRNGKSGDMHTTYEIIFANPNIYKNEMYPKDAANVFDNFNSIGNKVLDKSFEELVYFTEHNGTFPNMGNTSAPATPANTAPTMGYEPPSDPYGAVQNNNYVEGTARPPYGNGDANNGAPARPSRYY